MKSFFSRHGTVTIALLTVFALFSYGRTLGQIPEKHLIAPASPAEMQVMFSLKPESRFFGKDAPAYLIDAHRGGVRAGLPENCIPTFEDALKRIPVIVEIDPRLTKDDVVVLMHDETINRTTNGTGRVRDYTYEELQQFRLTDNQGNVTDYRIPTLKEVIGWAKGKTVLFLDKKDVPLETTMKIIRDLNAETCCAVIAYNYDEAKRYYSDNPNIMMEVFVTKVEDIERFDKTGVPWANVIPFVGNAELNLELVRLLRAKGRPCMIGCTGGGARSFDNVFRESKDNSVFKKLVEGGVSFMETDLPLELHAALNP